MTSTPVHSATQTLVGIEALTKCCSSTSALATTCHRNGTGWVDLAAADQIVDTEVSPDLCGPVHPALFEWGTSAVGDPSHHVEVRAHRHRVDKSIGAHRRGDLVTDCGETRRVSLARCSVSCRDLVPMCVTRWGFPSRPFTRRIP